MIVFRAHQAEIYPPEYSLGMFEKISLIEDPGTIMEESLSVLFFLDGWLGFSLTRCNIYV